MNVHLLLIGSIIFSFSIGSGTESNSNTFPEKFDTVDIEQPCTFINRIEYASFKYTSSDSFKTGKISAPALTLAADSIIYYKDKKYQVKLKHFGVQNAIFTIGSLSTSNTTVLLFTKEKKLHTLEVKGVGSFEFMGFKEDNYYFRLFLNDCTTYFSLGLNQSAVRITAYSVDSE